MTAALTPSRALDYLRALQPGIRDAAIGPPGEAPAQAAGAIRVRSENREIVVIPGSDALPGLLAHDAQLALEVAQE